MSQTIQGPPVVPSYAYALRVAVTGQGNEVLFPAGSALRAQVRHYVGSRLLLADLTTANGGITRVDDSTLDLRIQAEDTAKIRHTSIVLDIARTDPTPAAYLFVQLQIPVQMPVTVGGP